MNVNNNSIADLINCDYEIKTVGDLPTKTVGDLLTKSEPAKNRWKAAHNDIRSQRIWSLVKTLLAITAGLCISAVAIYFSASLISSESVTTGFFGLFSLILTGPVAIGVPLVLGLVVGKRQDWAHYEDPKVAEEKVARLFYTSLSKLKKINLDSYEKIGYLITNSTRKEIEEFKSKYKCHRKVLKRWNNLQAKEDYRRAFQTLKTQELAWEKYKINILRAELPFNQNLPDHLLTEDTPSKF